MIFTSLFLLCVNTPLFFCICSSCMISTEYLSIEIIYISRNLYHFKKELLAMDNDWLMLFAIMFFFMIMTIKVGTVKSYKNVQVPVITFFRLI